MSEILSKSELDALLGAMSEEELQSAAPRQDPQQSRRVKRYDFRRPYKLSNEQLRTLHMMHEVFGRQVQMSLSAHLRAASECNIFLPEQMTYEEYATRFDDGPSVLVIFGLKPLEGRGLLEVDSTLALAMIDRLLGGPGLAPPKARNLTEIEQTVLGRLCAKLLLHLQEGWHRVADLEPEFQEIEQNAQFAQPVPPSEMVVVVPFEIRFRQVVGNLSLCLPYMALEPLVPKLTTHYFLATQREASSGEHAQTLRKRMQNLKLPVAALLGTAQVRVSELLDLQVGDVIKLSTRSDGHVPIRVGHKIKFLAKPGRVGKRLGMQIQDVTAEEEEPDA